MSAQGLINLNFHSADLVGSQRAYALSTPGRTAIAHILTHFPVPLRTVNPHVEGRANVYRILMKFLPYGRTDAAALIS